VEVVRGRVFPGDGLEELAVLVETGNIGGRGLGAVGVDGEHTLHEVVHQRAVQDLGASDSLGADFLHAFDAILFQISRATVLAKHDHHAGGARNEGLRRGGDLVAPVLAITPQSIFVQRKWLKDE